ncbi:Endonuclease Reverse transcriptase [Phytophthora megakarya]|uniref:Endonuclease Reverse transcriptase n=1 Tax=Phytophthora megakarya TaxID=4795 RepID=A0A225W6A8_9STRA|nr:Endonuclease Reverse transcriptase [Phytophthora megakarya]
MNTSETELTVVRRCTGPSGSSRHARAEGETRRSTKKLGNLLGDPEDFTRQKTLAAATLRRLWSSWLRPQYISDTTRIRNVATRKRNTLHYIYVSCVFAVHSVKIPVQTSPSHCQRSS